MQKKLLGLAVASVLAAPGLALAQSSVEVYGTVNMSVNRFKFEPATGPSVSKLDVANHASNYGLRGRESLGGGLTAWFQIEQNAPLERSNNVAITPASRNSAVGIQGGFGNVFIGQWTTPWADLDALWSVGTAGGWGPVTSIIGRRETTGTAPNANCANGHLSGGATFTATCDAVEAAGGVGHPFWRRVSQSIFYQSPVFGGAQVKVAYQTNDTKATQGAIVPEVDPSLISASIAWTGMGGRARVGFALDRHEDFSSVGEVDTGWAIKGGYNLGVVNLGAAYEVTEYAMPTAGTMTYSGQDCESKQWGLAAAVPVGAGSVKASYAKAKAMEAGCVGGNVGAAKTYNIGYEHRFSKRTSVAVGYAEVDNETGAGFTWTGVPPNQGGQSAGGPGSGGDVNTIFVNITHRF